MTPFDERSKIEHQFDTADVDDCRNPNITDVVKDVVRSYYQAVSLVNELRAGCEGETAPGGGAAASRIRRVGGGGGGIFVTVVFASHADFQAARAIMGHVPTAVVAPVDGTGANTTVQLSGPPIAFDATQYSQSALYCGPLNYTSYTFGGDVCADSTFFCCFDPVCSACMGDSLGALPGACTINRRYQGYVLDCSTSCGDGLDRGEPSSAACLLALNELQLADALGVAPDPEVEGLYNASNCSCVGDAITAVLDCYVSNSSTSLAAPAVVPELFTDAAAALQFWFEAETQCGLTTEVPDLNDSDLQNDFENAFSSEVVIGAIIATVISALMIAMVVAALLRGQRRFKMKRPSHQQYSPEMVMAGRPRSSGYAGSFQAELYPEGFAQDRLGVDPAPAPGAFHDFDGLPTRGRTVHKAARIESDDGHGDEEGDGYGLVGDILNKLAAEAGEDGDEEEEDPYDNRIGLDAVGSLGPGRPETVWAAEPSAPPLKLRGMASVRLANIADAADAADARQHESDPAEVAANKDVVAQDVPSLDVPRFAPPIAVSTAPASRKPSFQPPTSGPIRPPSVYKPGGHRTRLSDGQLNI